jgi:SCP-2 sterol transfer family
VLVEFVVAQGKKEQARGYAHLDGTRIVGTESGAAPAPADLVFTMTPADATALHEGTLELSVGFMRGQVKMSGDFGTLLQFLPLTHGDPPAISVADLLPD